MKNMDASRMPVDPARSASAHEPAPQTFVYKQVGELEIKADVIGADPANRKPVVIWVHGGGLMGGNRTKQLPLTGMLVEAGYVVVSIDYRLAPETKLPGILEDVEDAMRWVVDQGPTLFNVDVRQIALAGLSAGGYLTLTAGHRCTPRPAVLVACASYGDLIRDWCAAPSKESRFQVEATREQAYLGMDGPAVTDKWQRKAGDVAIFYKYCRMHGLWAQECTGWDPKDQSAMFTPYMPLCNVTAEYPPTLLIHGSNDTDVPLELAVLMDEELEKHGVPHRLVVVPDTEHSLTDGDPKDIGAAYAQAVQWIDHYLK